MIENNELLNKSIDSSSYYHTLFKKINSRHPSIYQLINIARIINSDERVFNPSLNDLINPQKRNKKNLTNQLIDTKIKKPNNFDENTVIETMRSLIEFPYILKKQFLLPDEMFDRKLIFRELLVKKKFAFEKKISWVKHLAEKNQDSAIKIIKRQKNIYPNGCISLYRKISSFAFRESYNILFY